MKQQTPFAHILRVGMLVGAFVGTLASCSQEVLPPRGHILLFFDTDARIPLPTDQQTLGDAVSSAPLFDRLNIEVFEPGASSPCLGCRREIALDRRALSERRASIQIPATEGVIGYRVRARLFLAAHAVSGEAARQGTVEVVGALAPAPKEGGTEQTLFLATDDVGVPRGTLEQPRPLADGRPATSRVGTWNCAVRIPCRGEAPSNEGCIPGGAFWMGRPGESANLPYLGADRPRLVVLAPYFLDEAEVSVADIRAFEKSEPGVVAWSGKTTGKERIDFCTFTANRGSRDALPVSCTFWPTARHYCLSRGQDLPTEAQFE